MGTTHTSGIWWEYYPETNYAGGPAGALYATTAPSGSGELTECNYPYNEEQTMPWIEYQHEALEMVGQGITEKLSVLLGFKTIPGVIKQYAQADTWLDWALGLSPAETGGGAVPKSFLFHFDNGQVEYTAYGCYLTKYTLHIHTGKPHEETIEFNCYDVQAENVAMDTSPWTTTAIKGAWVVGTTALTIDGTAYTDVDDIVITITNHYADESGMGAYYHKYPYLLKREVEVEAQWKTYQSSHALDLFATTANNGFTVLINPVIVGGFQGTHMKVKPGSLNINTVPAKGIQTYKATFEIGGDGASVFTTP